MAKPALIEDGVAFNLAALAEELRRDENYERNGHTARTLVREPDLRMVLMVLRAGAQVAEHEAQHSAAIQVLSGRVRLALADRGVDLDAGGLLVLGPGLRHDVAALEDSAVLLSLGWRDSV